jgi:hypothetical protein
MPSRSPQPQGARPGQAAKRRTLAGSQRRRPAAQRAPWWLRGRTIIISTAAAVTLTLITDALTGGVRSAYQWAAATVTDEHSLEVAVSRGSEETCPSMWLMPGPVNREQISQTPVDEQAVRRRGGISVTPQYVELTIRGTSPDAIVLKDLRVVELQRRKAPTGTYLRQNCGGPPLTPRIHDVDLDRATPILLPRSTVGAGADLASARPFPYQVSRADAEVIRVSTRTRSCDCTWALELQYVDGERSLTRRIDDGGKPFRTLPVGPPPERQP